MGTRGRGDAGRSNVKHGDIVISGLHCNWCKKKARLEGGSLHYVSLVQPFSVLWGIFDPRYLWINWAKTNYRAP